MTDVVYERIDSKALTAAIRLGDGEHLLVLQPFGWHLDGSHIPNAAEHFSRESICEEHGWAVVDELGPYVAVVTSNPVAEKRAAAVSQVVHGHFTGPWRNTRWRTFVHRCPGRGCAIEHFLKYVEKRQEMMVELGQTSGADYTECPANSECDSEPALPQAGNHILSEPLSTS